MKSIYELLPQELKDNGYDKEIIFNIYKQLYIKKYIETNIRKVEDEVVQVNTMEGVVLAMPGMYIVTGVHNEQFVISKETLGKTYNKVENKENIYVKKPFPVIAEHKEAIFVVPCNTADSGFLKGKANDYLIQSMIDSKNIYPIDYEIFNETYIKYTDYLREKYGYWEEPFEEELENYLVIRKENIFTKIKNFFLNILYKREG